MTPSIQGRVIAELLAARRPLNVRFRSAWATSPTTAVGRYRNG
jgi:hypothetical protein